MNYPIEEVIKKNLKTVAIGIQELKDRREEYANNPGIMTYRKVKTASENLLVLIQDACDAIHEEWFDKYRNCVSEQEISDLTSQIMENLTKIIIK